MDESRRAETCILLYYMASAVEFSTTKVGCSTFKALWSLSIGPALGMCLFTKISYQNKAPCKMIFLEFIEEIPQHTSNCVGFLASHVITFALTKLFSTIIVCCIAINFCQIIFTITYGKFVC